MSIVMHAAGVALHRANRPFGITLLAGESLAIMGPSGSEKSRLARLLSGYGNPAVGTIEVAAKAALAESQGSKRATVQSLARQGGEREASRATEALTATGLWHLRRHSVGKLSPGQITACQLLTPFVSRLPLITIDGQLDLLDPWALRTALELLQRRLSEGVAAIVVTHRPEVAAMMKHLIVMNGGDAAYVGKVADVGEVEPVKVEVTTNRQPGVRALVDRFQLNVTQQGDTLVFESPKGQELAAKLLAQGYGDVKMVAVAKRSIGDAIVQLLERSPT